MNHGIPHGLLKVNIGLEQRASGSYNSYRKHIQLCPWFWYESA